MDNQKLKTCATCKGCKDIELFSKNCRSKDGHNSNCKECMNEYARKSRLGVDYYKRFHDKTEFGGLRSKIFERDGYKCVICSMTNEQHKNEFKKSLSIDHIDGNGINKPLKEKNNNPSNLQTLCLRCHGKKDVTRRLAY